MGVFGNGRGLQATKNWFDYWFSEAATPRWWIWGQRNYPCFSNIESAMICNDGYFLLQNYEMCSCHGKHVFGTENCEKWMYGYSFVRRSSIWCQNHWFVGKTLTFRGFWFVVEKYWSANWKWAEMGLVLTEMAHIWSHRTNSARGVQICRQNYRFAHKKSNLRIKKLQILWQKFSSWRNRGYDY